MNSSVRIAYTDISPLVLANYANPMMKSDVDFYTPINGLWYGYGSASKAQSDKTKKYMNSIEIRNPVFHSSELLGHPVFRRMVLSGLYTEFKEAFLKSKGSISEFNSNSVASDFFNDMTESEFSFIYDFLSRDATNILRIDGNPTAALVYDLFKIKIDGNDCMFDKDASYMDTDMNWTNILKVFDGIEFMLMLGERLAVINKIASNKEVGDLVDAANHIYKSYHMLVGAKNDISLVWSNEKINVALGRLKRHLDEIIDYKTSDFKDWKTLVDKVKIVNAIVADKNYITYHRQLDAILPKLKEIVVLFGEIVHNNVGNILTKLSITRRTFWALCGRSGMGSIWNQNRILGVRDIKEYDLESYLSTETEKAKKIIRKTQAGFIQSTILDAKGMGRTLFMNMFSSVPKKYGISI